MIGSIVFKLGRKRIRNKEQEIRNKKWDRGAWVLILWRIIRFNDSRYK